MAKVAQEPSTFHAVSVAVNGKEVPTGKSAQVLRQSYRRHVACLSNEERAEAILFRSLAAPRLLPSIGATLISSSLATLILAAHGVNERSREQTGSLLSCFFRGLIAGVWMTLIIAPVFLIFAPVSVRGSFKRRWWLCVPLTVSVGISAAFIPVEHSTLGLIPVAVITMVLSFVACVVGLNGPLFATEEHKKLDANYGPPFFICAVMFFVLLLGYINLTSRFRHIAVGLYVPLSAMIMELVSIFLIKRCIHNFYFLPKSAFLAQSSASTVGEAGTPDSDEEVPPILGDQERGFASLIVRILHWTRFARSPACFVLCRCWCPSSSKIASLSRASSRSFTRHPHAHGFWAEASPARSR